jgi:hypothetical protein
MRCSYGSEVSSKGNMCYSVKIMPRRESIIRSPNDMNILHIYHGITDSWYDNMFLFWQVNN